MTAVHGYIIAVIIAIGLVLDMMKPLKLLPQLVLAVFSLAVALAPAMRDTVARNW